MNLTHTFKSLLSFIMACFVSLFVIVYLLRIPQWFSNNSPLVHEYYYKNFHIHIPLDIFLIFVYLCFAQGLVMIFHINQEILKIAMVIFGTIIISGGFCLYFLSQAPSKSFFSKWFHSVRYKAVIYDVLLLFTVYVLYRFIENMVL